MATGIDLLVGMMLMGCVEHEAFDVSKDPHHVTAQIYECPLIGDKATFTVLRHVCSKVEQHAVALRDWRTRTGFYNNQFGEVGAAYVEVEFNNVYTPKCMTEPDAQ